MSEDSCSRIYLLRDSQHVWCIGAPAPRGIIDCMGYGPLFIVCRSLSFSDYPVSPLWAFSLSLGALSYAYGPFHLCLRALSFMPVGPPLLLLFLCAVLTVSLIICYPCYPVIQLVIWLPSKFHSIGQGPPWSFHCIANSINSYPLIVMRLSTYFFKNFLFQVICQPILAVPSKCWVNH